MSSSNTDRAKLQKLAYDTLSQYFQVHENEVIEIEVLPPAIQPPDGILLQDGTNLGVPKKILALAYIEARQQFFESKSLNNDPPSKAIQATKVILLFDPEHLTAANFRKLRILALRDELGDRHIYHTILRQELCFLNSILTSPLHRQSKSPTLWYHRLWLIDLLTPIEFDTLFVDGKAAFWYAEIVAVCKSGERHPKNYYAWQYARRLIPRIKHPNTVTDLAHHVKDWCCQHPSDISGWSLVMFLISRPESLSYRHELIRDVLNYAIDFYLEQESLWVFIKIALAQETLQERRNEFIQKLENYNNNLRDSSQHSILLERVSKTVSWIDTYRTVGSVGSQKI